MAATMLLDRAISRRSLGLIFSAIADELLAGDDIAGTEPAKSEHLPGRSRGRVTRD